MAVVDVVAVRAPTGHGHLAGRGPAGDRSTSPPTWRRLAIGVTVAAVVALLAIELRRIDVAATFAHVWWPLLGAALVATALSQVVAAANVQGFSAAPLRLSALVRAQLSICFARVLAPNALSTPAILTRHLTRSGLPAPAAVGVVAAAQGVQVAITSGLVVIVSVAGGPGWQLPLPGGPVVLAAAVVAVPTVAGLALLARRIPLGRQATRAVAESVRSVIAHVRQHPGRTAYAALAGLLLTVLHVTAFACLVAATGSPVSVTAVTLVYLGASTAGSLIPTPGGIGAVEAALTAGLVATGATASAAAAAAVLTRAVTVWAMVGPGWFAMRSLRREGLL